MRFPLARMRERTGLKAAQFNASSKNVAREVLVLDERAEMAVDVRGIDAVVLAALIGRRERNLVEETLQHRVQPPRADVFGALVDLERDLGEPHDAFLGELERDAFGR